MSRPGPSTYGDLMRSAGEELAFARERPPDVVGIPDMRRFANAEGVFYRSAHRILTSFATEPILDDREAAGIGTLRTQLAEVVDAAAALPSSDNAVAEDPRRSAIIGSALRGFDHAGAAWDLLDSRLGGPPSVVAAAEQVVRTQEGARAVLADVADAVRAGLTVHEALAPAIIQGLSAHLVSPAVRPGELDAIGKRAWRALSLDASGRQRRVDLQSTAADVAERLSGGGPRNGALDALTPYVSPRVEPPRSPSDLRRVVGEYSRWLQECAPELTVADLRTTISVASQLTHLTGLAHPSVAPECARTINGWRGCYHRLSHLATVHLSPDVAGDAVRLTQGLAKTLSILRDNPGERGRWKDAASDAVRQVPQFTAIIEGSLFAARDAGRVLSRVDAIDDAPAGALSGWQAPDRDGGRIEDVQLALRGTLRHLTANVLPRLSAFGGRERSAAGSDFALTRQALKTPLMEVSPVRREQRPQKAARVDLNRHRTV